MDRLMVGVSGLRGIVGRSLTPEIVTRWAMAFGAYLEGGLVVVARDTRPSGEMIKHAVLAGLMSQGCTVVDCDICATPACSVMVRELDADGGLMISGSHNPAEWNALKFLRGDGIDLNEAQGAELLALHDQRRFRSVPWHSLRPIQRNTSAAQHHVSAILAAADAAAIRARRPTVVLDAVNGAGAVATPALLDHLGCRVIAINAQPTGEFVRNPEPIAENLETLCRTVREHHADVGFAQDADADRLALVDEQGRFLGEELTLALVTRHVLEQRSAVPSPAASGGGTAPTPDPRPVVVLNISSSRMVDDVAARFGATVVRTKVGEVNVAEAIVRHGALIGGEGNGGVIDPRVCPIRDSLAGMTLILEYLAASNKPISQLAAELDRYTIRKTKLACTADEARHVLARARQVYADQRINDLDGIRIDWPDRWVQVRPSGTEPIIRIIAEAATPAEAERLCQDLIDLARPLIRA
jgi:phosphomannomutase